jgi:hypothetical protein
MLVGFVPFAVITTISVSNGVVVPPAMRWSRRMWFHLERRPLISLVRPPPLRGTTRCYSTGGIVTRPAMKSRPGWTGCSADRAVRRSRSATPTSVVPWREAPGRRRAFWERCNRPPIHRSRESGHARQPRRLGWRGTAFAARGRPRNEIVVGAPAAWPHANRPTTTTASSPAGSNVGSRHSYDGGADHVAWEKRSGRRPQAGAGGRLPTVGDYAFGSRISLICARMPSTCRRVSRSPAFPDASASARSRSRSSPRSMFRISPMLGAGA